MVSKLIDGCVVCHILPGQAAITAEPSAGGVSCKVEVLPRVSGCHDEAWGTHVGVEAGASTCSTREEQGC